MKAPERAFAALGALAGAGGVALAAMAAHMTGGGNLETASRFLLLHAPALLALAALAAAGFAHRGIGRAAGLALVIGLVLFCGDLSVRAIWRIAPWRLAAPTGGMLLILGWLALVVSVLVPSDLRRD